MFADPHYYPGSPTKPLLRGMTHKIALILFPAFIWKFAPEIWSACTFQWYGLCFGSMLILFISSTVYHHKMFDHARYLLVRKIDISLVKLSITINIMPALLVYDMWFDLYFFVLIFLVGQVLIWTSRNPRNPLLFIFALTTTTCLCFTFPRLLMQIPTIHMAELIAHAITMVVGMGLYWFAEHEHLHRWFGVHEFIHLLSIVTFLNFATFNRLLIIDTICV